jgi:hypothetical protein
VSYGNGIHEILWVFFKFMLILYSFSRCVLGCARKGVPGVYMKVTSFVPWIQRNLDLLQLIDWEKEQSTLEIRTRLLMSTFHWIAALMQCIVVCSSNSRGAILFSYSNPNKNRLPFRFPLMQVPGIFTFFI